MSLTPWTPTRIRANQRRLPVYTLSQGAVLGHVLADMSVLGEGKRCSRRLGERSLTGDLPFGLGGDKDTVKYWCPASSLS